MLYVGDFDVWLWEIYIPTHFDAYARHRAKRIGASPKRINAKTARVQILSVYAGVKQLSLFSVV
jgi:hypothetical protein